MFVASKNVGELRSLKDAVSLWGMLGLYQGVVTSVGGWDGSRETPRGQSPSQSFPGTPFIGSDSFFASSLSRRAGVFATSRLCVENNSNYRACRRGQSRFAGGKLDSSEPFDTTRRDT